MPLRRHAALILVPVLLLAGIAVFGLVEYRHAITAEARAIALRRTQQADVLFDQLVAATAALPLVVLYRDTPDDLGGASPDAQVLEEATAARDTDAIHELLGSDEHTPSGIPVSVLAAWRLFDLSEGLAEAEGLLRLAIHEAPSMISAPAVRALVERFPDQSGLGWEDEWQTSEARRAVLEANVGSNGFVATPDGPALVVGDRVMLADRLRPTAARIAAEQLALAPPWMVFDLMALDSSLVSPVAQPLVAGGSPLRVVVGIGDSRALYARYWSIFWWATALIATALGTAVTGIVLVTRTLARERRLGELKGQFVASVSHELRTPVASMRLMADALDAGKVRGGAAKEFHRLMSQEGARLASLIENVLDFARIEEGRKDYTFSETNMPKLVQDTIHLVEPVAAEREVAITSEIGEPGSLPVVDSSAIQQALVNLLDNAIKFSPRGGSVGVVLSFPPGAWQLAVSDEGPGIPAADRERVFDRFTRLGNELRRETRGTGIGLSIVKHIAEAHGGSVRINGGDRGGSEFVIHARMAPAAGSPREELS